MKAKSTATFLCGALLLVGCSHQPQQEFIKATPVSELQVAIGRCMAVDRPEASATTKEGNRLLLGALGQVLISAGVNYLGRAATEAGSAQTWKVHGARNFQATKDEFPQCIQVVRGRFLTEGAGHTPWSLPTDSGWRVDTKSEFDKRGLYLAGMPDFLFEAQIVPSQDRKSFAIRPVIATYLTPIGSRFLRPSKERNIALFFAITPPGTKPTLDTNPSATVVVGALQPLSTRRYALNDSMPSPYESPWFTLTREDAYKPLTLSVLMTETQGEQAFLKFIGSVLSEPTVVAAANADLANRLIPPVRNANEKAEQADDAKAIIKRNGYYLKTREKIAACANETDPEARRVVANEALEAMAGYVDADGDTSSPEGEISMGLMGTLRVNGDSSDLQRACQSLLNGLSK